MSITTIQVHGEEFVILPRKEYDRLRGVPEGEVDAVAFAREAIGRDLRAARERAGLTQAELAKRLRRSQAMVSAAENGAMRVGERYVKAVLRACGVAATLDFRGY